MKQLNLVYSEFSDINYQISQFPDGQQSITLIDAKKVISPKLQMGTSYPFLSNPESVMIKSHLSSFKDVEIIVCANRSLRNLGVKEVHLYVPYFIGARSDRKFVEGGTNYIKDVIAPIINHQKFESVTVIDPHSDVLEACIDNFTKVDNIGLVRFALSQIEKEIFIDDLVIVSPDAGALKKIYNVAEHFQIEQVLIAAKHRDIKTGKITHTEVPNLSNYHPASNFVIIDDICDGGRTFTEIAKVIESHVWPHDEYFRGKIYLVVTHGIFSAGLYDLSKHFAKIFCTNSYRDINAEQHSEYTVPEDFLQQLNIYR